MQLSWTTKVSTELNINLQIWLREKVLSKYVTLECNFTQTETKKLP